MIGESNSYSVLDGETELPGECHRADEGCVHSSDDDDDDDDDEEEEEVEAQEEEHGRRAGESEEVAHDCSGSRPLLLDSEEEEEQGSELPSQKSLPLPLSSTPSHQPTPVTQNHSHQIPQQSRGSAVVPDVFSKAPFRIGQEETGDVFANAPFPRPPIVSQKHPDVFLQAPFGKRKEVMGVTPQPQYPHPAMVHPVTPDQAFLSQVAPQPFRPQALAKYSRHFEGPLPQQPVAAHRVVSNVSRQAAVGSVPVGPLHSWTSEVSAVDPFVSAPFHLKAPQEKP